MMIYALRPRYFGWLLGDSIQTFRFELIYHDVYVYVLVFVMLPTQIENI